MSHETEMTIRQLLALDPSIPGEAIEHALHVLDPDRIPFCETPESIPFPTVRRMLGLSSSALRHYLDLGLLTRAYAPSRDIPVGVTLDSYIAFAERATGRKSRSLPTAIESGIRLALSKDPTIAESAIETGLNCLRAESDATTPLPEIVSYRTAAAHLRVTTRTIKNYVHNGVLMPVTGTGRKAIGITRESFLKMVSGSSR